MGGAEQVARADCILLPLPLDEARTPLAELLRGRKARRGGAGRQALGAGKDHRAGSGRGAGGLLCPAGADRVQCHPHGGGLHRHPAAERTRTLWGANILLLGFGPVGQALGVRLAALGADVTVCARRPEQRALAESLGLRAVQSWPGWPRWPRPLTRVVNTIPAPVLTEPVLAALRPGSLIVDLASKPGGTDFAAAQRLGLKAIHALSLPAVCAPETAGEAVARTVLAILQEREEAT